MATDDESKTSEEQKINVEFDHRTQYDTMLQNIYNATRTLCKAVDGNEECPEFDVAAKHITVCAAQAACASVLSQIPLMVLNEVSTIQEDIEGNGIDAVDDAIEVVEKLNKLTEVLATQLTYLELQQWAVESHIEEAYDDVCIECRQNEKQKLEE